ncbi:MAG: hypothetical protein HOP02_06870 [Methylococcaceae bacterium]|nr:hypothetical protein [Methylococcaceae bacterium]
MGDLIAFKKPKTAAIHKGNTLCRSGFHLWEILNESQFDVKQGRLMTLSRCKRCAKIKHQAL